MVELVRGKRGLFLKHLGSLGSPCVARRTGSLLCGTALATFVAAGVFSSVTIDRASAAACDYFIDGETEVYTCVDPVDGLNIENNSEDSDLAVGIASMADPNIWSSGILVENGNMNRSVNVEIFGNETLPVLGETPQPITISGDDLEGQSSRDAFRIVTQGGNVKFVTQGDVTFRSRANAGLSISSNGGDIDIDTAADFDTTDDFGTGYNGIDLDTRGGDVSLRFDGHARVDNDGIAVRSYERDHEDEEIIGGGDVGITVTRNASIDAGSDGVYVSSGYGNIDLTVRGEIYAGSDSLDANSTEGDIGIFLARTGKLYADDNGIEVETDSGEVNLRVAGQIDASDNGIDIENSYGNTFVRLERTSEILAGDDGINVDSNYGNVALLVNGRVSAGESAVKIEDGETVALIVGPDGRLVGEGSRDNAVVDINADEAIFLLNAGTIRSGAKNLADRANDIAINFTGGVDSLMLNADEITGRFNGSKGDDVFANAGEWTFTGNSHFGAGDDVLYNMNGQYGTGVIVNAVSRNRQETTQYLSLDGFLNAGVISLQDQESGDSFRRDRVLIDGDYAGDNGLIALDVNLGSITGNPDVIGPFGIAPISGPDSDRFIVNGSVSGTTFVRLNNIGQGPVEYDAFGIPVIQVGGDVEQGATFALENGPIDFGLYSYDLRYTKDVAAYDQDDDYDGAQSLATGGLNGAPIIIDSMWVLAATMDAEAYQMPVISYAAGNLWHATAGVWGDRTSDLRTGFAGTGFGGGGADMAAPTAANTGPGFWGRAFGGTVSRDFDNSFSTPGGTETYSDSFRQNYYGVVGGLDFEQENVGQNSAWLFGILGGLTGSTVDFDLSSGKVDYQQVSLGAYATYLNGGFFADAMFKADFGNMDFRSGGLADAVDASYTTIGVVADVGYRFGLGANWFIEPKATLAYSSTDFDSIDVLGAGVEFDDGNSLRGRLGARAGTTIDNGGNLITPYVEASVWNEFDGDYSAAFTGIGATPTVSYDVGGTYGEVAAGADFMNVGSGWTAYAKGSVQFGENDMLGFGGNLGFRKSW